MVLDSATASEAFAKRAGGWLGLLVLQVSFRAPSQRRYKWLSKRQQVATYFGNIFPLRGGLGMS